MEILASISFINGKVWLPNNFDHKDKCIDTKPFCIKYWMSIDASLTTEQIEAVIRNAKTTATYYHGSRMGVYVDDGKVLFQITPRVDKTYTDLMKIKNENHLM